MTLLIVLAIGIAVGRLSIRLTGASRLADCPKCALDEAEQRVRIEINALRRGAESRMAHEAEPRTRSGAAPRRAAPRTREEQDL